MIHKVKYFSAFIVLAFVLLSCGKHRKNFVAKTYHNTTAFFNGYYNARLKYKSGVQEINQTFQIPSDGYVPLLYFGSPESAKSAFSYFDDVITKCDLVIYKHPNSKWIDDCRFLNGKAWFYKQNFILARQNFEYIIKTYPDSKILPEVYLWLMMNFYMEDKEIMAEKILNSKEFKALEWSKKQLGELALFKSTLYIQKGEYDQAIKELELNVDKIKGKVNKARAHFLLGQLYANRGNFARSLEHFQKVTKKNTDYQIIFGAKISIAALMINNLSNDGAENVDKYLKKLLRDEKNLEYKDQVYYQMAMLDLKRENLDAAIEDFQLSARVSVSNQRQKALSYYEIGKIYFYDKKEFTNAEVYFDSASTTINADAPEYDEIQTINATLKDYVYNLNMVHYQDSMIWLAGMDTARLSKHIDMIMKVEQEKEKKRQEEMMKQMEEQNGFDPFNQFTSGNSGNSKGGASGFYFDNPQMISSGRIEYQRLWGARKNEDNWRRKNKQSQISSNEEVQEEKVDSTFIEKYGNKAKYYQDIPQNEEDLAAAHDKVKEALFTLGQIYEMKLNQADSAIALYKRVIQRYPDSEYALKSRYALYNVLIAQGRPDEAKIYKEWIYANAPNSFYRKLIDGEDISEDLAKRDLDFRSAYEALYTTFSNSDFETSVSFAKHIIENYPIDKRIPKVYFLMGQAYGKLGKLDSLVKYYGYIRNNFPEDDVTPVAIRTLKYIEGGPENNNQETKEGGNTGSFVSSDKYKGFLKDPKANEKVIVLFYINRNNGNLTDLKAKVSDFNDAHFKTEKLTASTFFYKQQYYIVYISQFNTYTDALNYVKMAKQEEKLNAFLKGEDDRFSFITPENFKVSYGQKRFEDYFDFYDNVILKSMK